MIPALLLALLPLQDAPPSPSGAEAVLTLDGRDVPRRRYEDWLLYSLGEDLAASFAELVSLRRAAAEAGVALAPEGFEERARAEFRRRIEGAFGGDEDRWREELAREGRSEPHGVAAIATSPSDRPRWCTPCGRRSSAPRGGRWRRYAA